MSRGRGRGQLTFNAELLGIVGRGDAPSSVLTPPAKYPPRLGKPRPLLDDADQDFLAASGRDLVAHFRASPFFIRASSSSSGAKGHQQGRAAKTSFEDAEESPSSQAAAAAAPLDLDWTRFPKELRPDFCRKGKKRKATREEHEGAQASKRRKTQLAGKDDVTKRLADLEKKEGEAKSDEEGEGESKEKKEGGDSEDEENPKEELEESEAEEPDEEMDEGTDYANNYFDNGDGYLDEEDDNLDEGGIY